MDELDLFFVALEGAPDYAENTSALRKYHDAQDNPVDVYGNEREQRVTKTEAELSRMSLFNIVSMLWRAPYSMATRWGRP